MGLAAGLAPAQAYAPIPDAHYVGDHSEPRDEYSPDGPRVWLDVSSSGGSVTDVTVLDLPAVGGFSGYSSTISDETFEVEVYVPPFGIYPNCDNGGRALMAGEFTGPQQVSGTIRLWTVDCSYNEYEWEPRTWSASTTAEPVPAPVLQPDLLISTTKVGGYVGNGVYGATPDGQVVKAKTAPGTTRTFYVKLQNDGSTKAKFVLRGTKSPTGAVVRYFDGTTDVSKKMRSDSGYAVKVEPGVVDRLRIKFVVSPRAELGSRLRSTVKASWTGDEVVLRDAVRAVVVVRR